MNQTFGRYLRLISRAEPRSLESALRGLLINLHFHLSDRQAVRVPVTADGKAGSINLYTPTQFKGEGTILLDPSTVFGVVRSPGAFSCSYVEVRGAASHIRIGAHTTLNNRATLISDGASITIGARCMLGPELVISDSNSHELAVERRGLPDQQPLPVTIGNDVFTGFRVTILKGCTIGDGCVIAAGSVLPPKFTAPPRTIVAGNPARVVGTLDASTHRPPTA